jgi:hypothetical protein
MAGRQSLRKSSGQSLKGECGARLRTWSMLRLKRKIQHGATTSTMSWSKMYVPASWLREQEQNTRGPHGISRRLFWRFAPNSRIPAGSEVRVRCERSVVRERTLHCDHSTTCTRSSTLRSRRSRGPAPASSTTSWDSFTSKRSPGAADARVRRSLRGAPSRARGRSNPD